MVLHNKLNIFYWVNLWTCFFFVLKYCILVRRRGYYSSTNTGIPVHTQSETLLILKIYSGHPYMEFVRHLKKYFLTKFKSICSKLGVEKFKTGLKTRCEGWGIKIKYHSFMIFFLHKFGKHFEFLLLQLFQSVKIATFYRFFIF